MPTVDYFAGVNEGNKNLMAAMDTYGKEERQKGIDAMNAALHQKQLDQADFTLGEAKEKSKRNRETLADISRIGGMTEKIPSAISASPLAGEPKLSPGTVGPTPEGEYAMDEYTPGSQIQSIPAVNYTPQDKHTMMLESAIRNGDWETAAKVGQVVDVTQKIAAEQRTQLEAWARNLKAFREAVKNPKAVAAFAKSSAATYGVDPALTEGIDFTATGDIIKSDGQGGTISIIEMPDGTFKEVHASAKTPTTDSRIVGKLTQELGRAPTNAEVLAEGQRIKSDAMLKTPERIQQEIDLDKEKKKTAQAIKDEGGFSSWTPEAKSQAFIYNMLTTKPPVNAQGMQSNDRKAYGKEYAQWQVDKGLKAQDIALMQADYRAGDMSLKNMTKQEAPMAAFVGNINKQIEKVKALYDNNDRTGLRMFDLPIRELKTRALGSGEESVKASYLLEISNEIGKLSSGASASIQQLSDSAKEDWKKVHDVNLSMKDIMTVLNATRDQANMRMSTWRDAKEEVRNALRSIGVTENAPNSNLPAFDKKLPLGAQTGKFNGVPSYSADGGKTIFDMTGKRIK